MSTRPTTQRLFSILVIVSLLLNSAAAVASAAPQISTTAAALTEPESTLQLYRTQITLHSRAQEQRLNRLGLEVLARDGENVTLLVDATQLETLAQRSFSPQNTESLTNVARVSSAAWLETSLQPLLQQMNAVSAASAEEATATLRASMHALGTEQRSALAETSSIDDDGDGLTNTQESWWCTDALNPDSDGDGSKDGVEVNAAKAWLANQASAPPASGKPFSGWPATKSNCPDDDQDSVPDLAERWELGLNWNRESSDRDKFDDGQELFGNTYCPGSGGFCGYGALPRNEDWGVIFAEMPSWVKAPGNHPLVAAFPKPEIDVVQSSFHLQTVTVVTTDHTINSGTERTYSTAQTEGTSTSESNSVTWNEWQEMSITSPINNYIIKAAEVSGSDYELELDGQIKGNATAQGCASGAAAGGLGLIGGGASAAGCANINVTNQGDAEFYGIKSFLSIESLELPDFSLELPDINLSDIDLCLFNCSNDSFDATANSVSVIQQGATTPSSEQLLANHAQTSQTQDNVNSGASLRYALEKVSNTLYQVTAQRNLQMSIPQKPTRTESKGKSWGGAQTTTTEKYEEHTVTNGEAFSNGESWGNATAQASAHAADLWFTYKVRNTGTEYAREIANLAFNLYIGDDPNPAYTYFVATNLGGDGKFHNFMPNEEHPYTSQHIPLSLEQMKAIDLGGPIRIVVEDFTYGIDELFYEDAANAGVLIAMEDGTDDGNESIDPYLLPTWGTESALDVLTRYFPHETDADSTIIAIWTPEYRSDTPAWCQEAFRPSGASSLTLWCKHALSTADWWNIYTNGLGDGSEGFQDTPATPGAVALFRFNKDSDLDGFSDRSEAKLGTDSNDPASFPRPELLAGVHSLRVGNNVTATLSLLNSGLYDAYGVEAILVAADDSVTVTNNTVGGSGRVRALNQVIVGSHIALPSPLPAQWTQANHATPAAGGYYTGASDRTYTFTVNCSNPGGCAVGSDSWTVSWNDGAGNSGTLNLGAGYTSPTFLPVGSLGVTFALYSGNVNNGDTLTVSARTPRDTFQYTINREPYTQPLVIVSYNDPQGNHRLIVPPAAMQLTTPNDDLTAFAGTMWQDVGVEIVTTAAFSPGANATKLLVNNPSATQLTNAHLFLEFIDPSGTVVHEATNQATLPPGPSYVTVNWDSGSFSPAYNSQQDYIVLAFLTDYQGNILDTGGRPLSSFQADPLPTLVTDNGLLTWNFGTVGQGALLRHRLSLANTGFGPLYTFVDGGGALELSNVGQRTVGAAGVADYQLSLQTASLPVGAYDETFTIKSSDPAHPALTFHVLGTIAAPSDTPAGAIQRPLDVAVTVTGPKTQGQQIEFTHTLGPDTATLHPVKIFNNDYTVLKGVGEYATDFAAGTSPADMFGDGRDGIMPSSGNLDNDHGSAYGMVNSGSTGSTNITVTDIYGVGRINPGDVVLIHQTQGTNAGCWEINKAVSDFSGNPTVNTYQLVNPLKCTYASGGNNHAQIVRVPQYSTCNVTGTVTPIVAWNGTWGGIFAVMCNTPMTVSGSITANAWGYRGGLGDVDDWAWTGEGDLSPSIRRNIQNPPGNGGGANHISCAGGGNGTSGVSGGEGTVGDAAGTPDLSTMVMGGGGGGAGGGTVYGSGGTGGGIVVILAESLSVSGSILSDGNVGQSVPASGRSGCGGAGGSIYIKSRDANISSGIVRANAGAKGTGGTYSASGDGGLGRIRIEYCDSLNGTAYPAANTQKLNCYIAQQGAVAVDLFGDGRDGVMPSVGNLDNNNGTAFGSINGTANSTIVSVGDWYSIARINPGDFVLIHQTRGVGAGNWELNKSVSDFTTGSTYVLQNPLKYSYVTDSGSNRAQIVRVPQYSTCNVTGTLTQFAWNGNWGGIFAAVCQNTLTVSGTIMVDGGNGATASTGNPAGGSGGGFRGGQGDAINNDNNGCGYQGEGIVGLGAFSSSANGNGGGAGCGSPATGNYGTGGGGGNGAPGGASTSGGIGTGGNTAGNAELTNMVFGGGGAGSNDNPGNSVGGGGSGGGIIVLQAPTINVPGAVRAAGGQGGGDKWGGGAGAGGSILLRGNSVNAGTSLVTAPGGAARLSGAAGAVGRIRIEYCDTVSGTTGPTASTQKINCYIAQQGETGTSRFLLPENIPTTATYQVQFGRKLDFTGTGEQIPLLRLPAGALSESYLDMLISGVGSGLLTARLDIGNDGTWDLDQTVTANGAIALISANLAAAFNAYWSTHGMATAGTIDVPVKVSLSKAGQVLLTNLQTSAAPSLLRTVQIPAANYQSLVFNLTAGSSGTGSLSLAIDVGNNGTIDWSSVANRSFPAQVSTANLATAINAYLAGNSGMVNVPLRIYLSPQVPVTIDDYSATVAGAIDLVAESVSAPSPSDEGSTLALQATLRNGGSAASGPLTAAFFATLPDWGDWYVGSAFLADLAAGASNTLGINWETTGFRGDVPVKVVVTPYQAGQESNTSNNLKSGTLTVRSRPDLHVTAINLDNAEPLAGEAVVVNLILNNQGQQSAASQTTTLYNNNPNSGGTVIGEASPAALAGGANNALSFNWTPTTPGLYRLYSRSDRTNLVNEYDEGNNDSWRDIYVGLASPVLLDSGAAGDVAYNATTGYGYVDEGQPDVLATCGTAAHQSFRRDPDGKVQYRFDHLQPGHFYHLNITMFECVAAGRSQSVYVDNNLVAGPEDLGDGQIHQLSIRLDPALYADRSIAVSVEDPSIDGALVSEVNLVDVSYRYADAGGPQDATYSASRGYGWVDGTTSTAWGTLPYQSVRVDQADNELRYRFDNLDPATAYKLNLTFWQPNGQERIQKVLVNGIDMGIQVDTGDYQIQRVSAPVPVTAYASGDHSVVVSIVRLNGSSGAMVNEIALEAESLTGNGRCNTQPTPYRMDVYGVVNINGQPAPLGALVEALDPRGNVVGCFTVTSAGQYGFMPIYGEDTTHTPAIPGMRTGEMMLFKVNGIPAVAAPKATWQEGTEQQVDLNAGGVQDQSIALRSGWNLLSTYIQPLLPPVRQALGSIDSRYDRVLSESGVFAPSLEPIYNTLSEFHSGAGYYLRTVGSSTTYLLVQGVPDAANTPIALHTGWNWIGYLPRTSQPTATALQGIAGQYQRVLSLDKSYVPTLPGFSTLQQLTPGEGYLIYMNQAAALVYPNAVATLRDGGTNNSGSCASLQPTPSATLVYGYFTVNEMPLALGSVVEVLTPRDEVAGCFVVTTAGQYGFMHVYGADNSAEPAIPGFSEGETLRFRVNGFGVTPATPLTWSDDKAPHQVDFQVEADDFYKVYLPTVANR